MLFRSVVVPRGAAAILIKESAQQRRMQFLQLTANPIDMQIIGEKGRAALLREVASAMELPVDDIVPDADAIEKRQREQAQAQQAQQEQALQMQSQQEQAKAASQAQAAQIKLLGDIVRQAVSGSMAQQRQGAEQPQPMQ